MTLREIPEPVGIRQAKTLPASAYASVEIHEREHRAIFRRDWVCAGVTDEMPAAGSWTARVAGGLPVLFVRDKAGELRAFLNVCRHRASPLCEDGETHGGSPGWEELASVPMEGPYGIGGYLTIWPNVMMNVFPGACLAMWMEPIDATTTRVERRLFVRSDLDDPTRKSIISAHQRVHEQDVDICTHNAGIDADGVVATVEERGVYFVHELLRKR